MSREVLSIWTVYQYSKDYPAQFVARRFESTNPPTATTDFFLADDLNGIREQLPGGLHCLSREAGDDPVIVESWL